MNLILNRHLDRGQEQAIYELTLKKQRSKKSTISRSQVERMQQLACELMPQRKDLSELINELSTSAATANSSNTTATTCCRLGGATANHSQAPTAATTTTATANGHHIIHHHYRHDYHYGHELCRCNSSSTTSNDSSSVSVSNELQRQSSTSTIATNSTSSSAASQHLPPGSSSTSNNSLGCSSSTAGCLEQETSIKINQMRLEHLNNELKRRLNQYEYLVAQEKAILGTHQKALTMNEGVNNFHLYH